MINVSLVQLRTMKKGGTLFCKTSVWSCASYYWITLANRCSSWTRPSSDINKSFHCMCHILIQQISPSLTWISAPAQRARNSLLDLIWILLYPVEVQRYPVTFSWPLMHVHVFCLSLLELSITRKLHGNSAWKQMWGHTEPAEWNLKTMEKILSIHSGNWCSFV